MCYTSKLIRAEEYHWLLLTFAAKSKNRLPAILVVYYITLILKLVGITCVGVYLKTQKTSFRYIE